MRWLLPLTIITYYLSYRADAVAVRGISSQCSPTIWDALLTKLHSLPSEFESSVCHRGCRVGIVDPVLSSQYSTVDDLFGHIIRPAIEEAYSFMARIDMKYPTPLPDLLHVARLVTDIAETCAATYHIHSLCPAKQSLLQYQHSGSDTSSSSQFSKCFVDSTVAALVDRVSVFMPWLKQACHELTPEMIDRLWKRAVLGNMRQYGNGCVKTAQGFFG
ncbi:uncharacterized protein TRUGW13939_11764 [Talaromyces rugulosus]|uniref:Uncharacterized protein n=1 Tax=Talaromyces rugulosus TaxID=121627 RepID=A0A7H8RDP4_TALRU|nr:uncharacterized protein TRUGW13939_11764 [Talaromyces rugulosus]QKX64589.1 hypothetical protein TRUGW13939_11764 [Talaromyces rugulosus]